MKGLAHFTEPLRGRPQVVALLVFAGLVMSGNGLVAPILSVYGASLSASGTLVGMVITIFGVGRLLVNIPAGMLAQRFGRRPVLLAGPMLLIAGSVGAALATDMAGLLAWRLVQGVGSGVYMTVSTVMLADMATDADRGRLMALYQASLLLGAGLGPAIGGFVADLWGHAAPFWAYGLVCAAGLAVAALGIGETLQPADPPRPAKDAAPTRTSPFGVLRSAEYLAICVANFAIFFTRTAAFWMALPMLAVREHGFSLGVTGLAIALVTAANFLMLPWSGQAIERFGAARVSLAALALTGAALAMIGLGGREAFWTGLLILGAAGGFSGPAVATQAAEIAPRRYYGQSIGVLRTSGDLGFVLGPLILGLLGDLAGMTDRAGILLNALLMLAAAAAMLGSARRHGLRRNPGVEASPLGE